MGTCQSKEFEPKEHQVGGKPDRIQDGFYYPIIPPQRHSTDPDCEAYGQGGGSIYVSMCFTCRTGYITGRPGY